MKLPRISSKYIRLFQPDLNWFLRSPEGVHGISHETRVLILSQILQKYSNDESPDSSPDVLGWASVFHDTRRIDDDDDEDHGSRSAEFVKNICSNKSLKEKFWPKIDVDEVAYLCEWHVPDDSLCPKITDNLKVFKDADALDRWRIQDLDTDYLRLKSSHNLVEVSRKLWKETRYIGHEVGENIFELIVSKAVEIGILD